MSFNSEGGREGGRGEREGEGEEKSLCWRSWRPHKDAMRQWLLHDLSGDRPDGTAALPGRQLNTTVRQ